MSQLFVAPSPSQTDVSLEPESLKSLSKFIASTLHVAHLAEVLGTLSSISTQALVILLESGVTLFAEYNHIANVLLTIDASLFSSFELTLKSGSDLRFSVDIQLIGDSFATASAAKGKETVMCFLMYEGEGHPLVVEFEDSLMTENIQFATFLPELEYPYDDDVTGLVVSHDDVEFEVIVTSDVLAQLLQDLQTIDTQEMYMLVSREEKQRFDFISKGVIGYLKLIFPTQKTMLEKLEMFQGKETIVCAFSFSQFVRIFKAVKLSTKCKITRDSSGVVSVQLLCDPLPANPSTIITFNLVETATDVSLDVDARDLFEDDLYENVREYDTAGTGSAFTYALREKTAKRRHVEPRLNDPIDMPLFL